jgi:hypothetical protein
VRIGQAVGSQRNHAPDRTRDQTGVLFLTADWHALTLRATWPRLLGLALLLVATAFTI